MNLKLKEMEASDMLDVIHFFFEEDSVYVSREDALSTSEVRKNLYEKLYEKEYKYYIDPAEMDGKSKKGGRQYVADSDFVDTPFDPLSQGESKSFTPATQLKEDEYLPFGPVLDAPIG
jgi:hypothetical protein